MKLAGASRGIIGDADCVFRISRGGLRMLGGNVPLKLFSHKSIFNPKCTKYHLAAGLWPDPLGKLTALPQIPLVGFKGAYF